MNKNNFYLSIAATTQDINGVINAIQLGADVDQNEGELLIEAISAEDANIVELLVSLGANVNGFKDGTWGEPLAIAARTGNTAIVSYLLGKGAIGFVKATAAAVCSGKPRVLQVLMEHGATIEASVEDINTALVNKNTDTAIFLIENGTDTTQLNTLKCLENLNMYHVINYVINKTNYLPSKNLYKILNVQMEYFLSGITFRQISKTIH